MNTARIRRLWEALRGASKQHAAGMLGQIAAGLPLLLITGFIARSQGLIAAGQFTVAAAVGAAAFSIAWWEIRSYLVVNGFAECSPATYVTSRTVGLFVAAVVTIIGSTLLGVSPALSVVVVLLRSSDGIIDLNLGFALREGGVSPALWGYAQQHGIKLLVLTGTGGLAVVATPRNIETLLIGAGILALVLSLRAQRAIVPRAPRTRVTAAAVTRLYVCARWFALATAGSVLMNTLPRIVAATMYANEMLGVVGISLSIAGLFGIAFFTTWLRYLPKFGSTPNRTREAARFIAETAALALGGCLVAYTLLPWAASVVFGFHTPAQVELSRDVLVTAVLFFGCMTLVNIYKVSATPWLEFVAYLAAIGVCVVVSAADDRLRSIPTMLICAGCVMALGSLIAFRTLRGSNR